MPAEWSEESFKRKEERKWEQPNYNPANHPFPMMLYKAQRQPISGKFEVCMERDIISADKTVVLLSAEQFNASCQLTVNSQAELEMALSGGWRRSHSEAMDYYEGLQNDIAKAAAHRAHDDRNMSEKAKAEADKIEASHYEHVPEIVEKPKKRRGRPPKVQ